MFIVKETGTGAEYLPLPPGTHTARLIELIDLGNQKSDFDGKEKTARKLQLGFEILGTEHRRSDGAPFVVRKRFSAGLHVKSALRKFLESWRGKAFTAAELEGFDLQKLIGQVCLLSTINTDKGDRTYSNLVAAMRMPTGMTAPAGELAPVLFSLEAPDWHVYATLPAYLQAQIESSPEFKALPNRPRSVSLAPTPTPTAPRPATAPQTPAQAIPEPPPGYDFAPLDAADADLIPF